MFSEGVDDFQRLQDPPLSPTAAHFGAGDVGNQALIPSITFTLLATIVVALRWYTRSKIVCFVGLDDYVILFSLLIAWSMCILIGISVHDGIGRYNDHQHKIEIAKLIVTNNTLWSININITKASILAQYLRVFREHHIRIACYILLATLLPAVCWGTMGGVLLCSPIPKLWNPAISGTCRNAQTYWVSVAAVDILLDFIILGLPLPSIARLNLPRRQKTATMLAFLLGFIVCLISVVRLGTVLGTANQGDYIMSGIWSIIWSAIEANVGIICASLLSLKALLTNFWPKLLEEKDGTPRRNMEIRKISTITVETEWRSGASQELTLQGSCCTSEENGKEGGGIGTRQPAACLAPTSTWTPGHRAKDSRSGTAVDFHVDA